MIVSMKYKSFEHGTVVQSANSYCHQVYFIINGAIAVTEETCFKDPVMIYGPGAFFNFYQVIMNADL